jgi:serine acetyltransferase
VTIKTGAIIVGKVQIESNSIIRANAVIIKDVPDNSTAFYALPHIMKWSGSNPK